MACESEAPRSYASVIACDAAAPPRITSAAPCRPVAPPMASVARLSAMLMPVLYKNDPMPLISSETLPRMVFVTVLGTMDFV